WWWFCWTWVADPLPGVFWCKVFRRFELRVDFGWFGLKKAKAAGLGITGGLNFYLDLLFQMERN
ncbi:MAG TPA: hypothetical protein VMD97_13155, partial [Candidatus Aquilonibacter sp.]|nr:hypothetical protein [Candidatus Aquilonibacter sp.]